MIWLGYSQIVFLCVYGVELYVSSNTDHIQAQYLSGTFVCSDAQMYLSSTDVGQNGSVSADGLKIADGQY